MNPERVFSHRRFSRAIPTLWMLLLASTIGLTLYAGRYWKWPQYTARQYWASRLTGSPQAFLGSDTLWHYFGLDGMFLHGWEVGRVSREGAELGRGAGVRAHIDELILSPEDKTAELQQFTGLSIDSPAAWLEWWRENRQGWERPARQEQLWEARAVASWGSADWPHSTRIRTWYVKEIGRTRSKTILEMLFFTGLLLLVWPVCPWAVRTLWSRCHRYRIVTAAAIAVMIVLVLYTAAAFPHLQWGYGMGASTTLSGPGFLSYSGPYPFHLHYRPGDTVLYRQFLELVFDPCVRLANAGLLRWLPGLPLAAVAPLPYLAAALMIGIAFGVRNRARRAPA